ncbi:hypothetical protein ABIE91_004318 [Bradyrhizobium elkanii]|jgi:hypothetical protein
MHTDQHQFDSVEIAFVGAAAVSLVALIASVAWLFLG